MGHHRAHVTEFIDEASDFIKVAAKEVSAFGSEYDHSTLPDISESLRVAQDSLTSVNSLMVDVSSRVHTAKPADLDEIRKLINQPDKYSQPQSLLNMLGSALFYIGELPATDPRAGDHIKLGINTVKEAWRLVDFALWHVNDAIRDEIYNDPKFAAPT